MWRRVNSVSALLFSGTLLLGLASCGGVGGNTVNTKKVYSGEIVFGGTRANVVIDLTQSNSDSGGVRIVQNNQSSTGKLAGVVSGNSININGQMPAPYGHTSVTGTIVGNQFLGTVASDVFDNTSLTATVENGKNPYDGWVKMTFSGPNNLSGEVPGYWASAGDQPYVNLDSAYIPDPNYSANTNAFGTAIYTGGGTWFALMRWDDNTTGYSFQALLLPGSSTITITAIQNNQIVVEGDGTFTLTPYTP